MYRHCKAALKEVCKLCGEVLASRTHWYRHKYKFHVNNNLSRKGYMGHLATRHSEEQEDIQVVVKEEIVETSAVIPAAVSVRKRSSDKNVDWEEQRVKEEKLVADIINREEIVETFAIIPAAVSVRKRSSDKNVDWEEQRMKEEKLVANIINRSKKECEAQGAAMTRRRRSACEKNDPDFIELRTLAQVCDRYDLSDRSAAVIASDLLKDAGIITEVDNVNIVDKTGVRGVRKRKRLCSQDKVLRSQ
ncbi:unnamed protein product [Phaedon cochleariae]|uniref:C2H2-type domain-containing protein n=1 Tax=Phaedon cochleariae TaxID=80249 RepID=A0A9N9SCR4_PHACE|nr:unnamed protein product [Phaedon cochleariae]